MKMGRCHVGFVVWLVLTCFTSDALQQYREKNMSGAETDAVQAILARYLQRRLQGSQLSTPPPPAVLFSSNNQARVRQAQQRTTSNAFPRNVSEKEDRERVEDYEDYEDDLEGFEDSERSRTRFDLFAELEALKDAVVHVNNPAIKHFQEDTDDPWDDLPQNKNFIQLVKRALVGFHS